MVWIERDAVLGQQLAHLAEEGGVVVDADVLEHADRDDAVELAVDLAVVLQLEAHGAAARPCRSRALLRDLQLLDATASRRSRRSRRCLAR